VPSTTQPAQRTVALSAVDVSEGFNPREDAEQADIARLAESIKAHGLIHPLVVTRVDRDGRLRLIDGERRYRACLQASLAEVPVIVRDTDEATEALDVALVANMQRVDLSPPEQAKAFQRLVDRGLTRKGVAETLGVSQKLVRERLQILELPEGLHAQVGDGTIPTGAVKALAELGRVHPGLPVVAVRGVLDADEADGGHRYEPPTWAGVIDDPVGHVASAVDRDSRLELPDGVYEAATSHPLGRFSLTEKATRQLAQLEQLGRSIAGAAVWFDGEAVAAAEKLGAAHRSREGRALIVGQDVADQLACDQVAAALKQARAQARSDAQFTAATASREDTDGEQATAPAGESPEQAAEARRREREAQQEARRAAVAHNDELGSAIVKHFAKLKVDERVVKILAAVDFGGALDKIACRGARYGMAGFERSEELRSGKTKRTYLQTGPAGEQARTFLKNAGKAPGDLAGRMVALAVMARYADEGAVAQSSRSFSQVDGGGELPWSLDTLELIDELAAEHLPAHLLDPGREQREAEAARRREARENREWLAEQLAGLGAMTPEQRTRVATEATERFGDYSTQAWQLRDRLDALDAGKQPAGRPRGAAARRRRRPALGQPRTQRRRPADHGRLLRPGLRVSATSICDSRHAHPDPGHETALMPQLLTVFTFVAGAVVGGLIADTTGDFLLLLTSTIAIATGLSSLLTWWNEDEPRRWDRAVGHGAIIGLAVGLILAIVDTLFPS